MTLLRLSVLFILLIPVCTCIQLKCYTNAALNVLSNNSYSNITCESCQCLAYQQNSSAFQCDQFTHICTIFSNNASTSNLRIQLNSTVCFFNRTTSVIINPPTGLSVSANATGSQYTMMEEIYLTNNVTLSYLTVKLTSYKDTALGSPSCQLSVSQYIVSWTLAANETNTSGTCVFSINNGQSLPAKQYSFSIQFGLSGVANILPIIHMKSGWIQLIHKH